MISTLLHQGIGPLNPYALSQICAFCALCLGIAAYRSRCDNCLKINIGISSLFMAAHFALLGAWVGMGLCLVSALRYITSRYSRSDFFFTIFLTLGITIGMVRFETLPDVLAIIAATLATIAVFKLHGPAMRLTLLGVSTSWLLFNLVHHSIMGMGLELFYIITNLRNLYLCHYAPIRKRGAVCNPYPSEEVG